jgi:hypothetical protein
MSGMSHDEAAPELAAVALDAATPEIASAVRIHASVCPECGPELAALEDTGAALAELVPASQINRGRGAGIRSRLLMRARAERESRSAPVPGPPDLARGVASLTGQGARTTPMGHRPIIGDVRRLTPPVAVRVPPESRSPRMSWYAIAATLAFVATGAQLMRVMSERDNMRRELAASVTDAQPADSLMSALVQKDSMIATMTGPDVKIVPLSSRLTREPMGRVMWNRASNDWVMVTHDMSPPRRGMTYQVWLVTDKGMISAGTFRPDAEGKMMMHGRHTIPRDALRSVQITEEPEGGMPAPTGPMVVVGAA